MPLSDATIRNTKPGPTPKKLADGGGMYLLLNPSGSRWWRLDYRHSGKRKTISLGTYPDTGLKDAREKRDAARKLLASGIDPGEHRKASKQALESKSANSFEIVAREWLSKRPWVLSYSSKVKGWLENDLFPWIGSRPVAELTAPEVLACLRRVENRGAIESSHRILQNAGQILRYAIATGRADRNVAADLVGALTPSTEKHRAAITEPSEIGGLLRAIDGYHGSLVTKSALKLAPLLFVRPGELRGMEWSELDLDGAQWKIPAARMKTRTPHVVPLCTQAVSILNELEPLTGGARYVFPSPRTDKRPMSNNAILSALRRMGYEKEEMSGHGFRAMARTVLDEVLHFRPDFIEHQLAHSVRDPNGRAYNRTAHLSERRAMMQEWADYLDGLKAAPSKLLPVDV